MKKFFLSSVFIFCILGTVYSQIQGDYYIGKSASIGRGNKYAPPNAVLEIGDTLIKKGMYLPRVMHRDSVVNPSFGLQVYDMSDNNVYVRTRTQWINLTTGGGLNWGSIPGVISSQTDLMTLLAGKQNSLPSGTTAQYIRGNHTLATLDKNAVNLGLVQNVDQTNATNLTSGVIPTGRFGTNSIPLIALNVTGTADNSRFIRGDGQYAKPVIQWGEVQGSLVDQPDVYSAIASKEALSNKGLPNGYASLSAAGRVPITQLGTGGSSPTDVLRFDGTWGPGGAADNWGAQTVQRDATLKGNGTSGSPAGVDTAKIATKYDIDTSTKLIEAKGGIYGTQTGNIITLEHKEVLLGGVADLRTWSGPINTNYIYKVAVDDTMTREFKYDPNDVLSADNGVTVIVNGSGDRYKLETTVLNGAKFGMRGNFDPGTGTGFDNTSAMRKMFSLFTGNKNARNLAIQVPAGEYGFLDTLATPNSAGFFTIRGEGRYTTTLWYKGPAGKDFLTLRNAQKATLEDFEMASYNHASAMIRLTTDAGIIGSSGMVSHVLIRNIDMRGNRGAYDYGIRKTCTPDHDQNNEQTLMENCFIDLPEITAYSNEMFNALWDRAENCYFSGKRRAISLAKPNPGGTVDSAGGSLDMVNCTIMTLSGSDTLAYIFGGQLSILNGRSEGPGRTMIYARKSAEGSAPIIRITGGSYTMGLAQGTGIPQGEYNINAAGAYITLDNTILNPAGLLKFRITDSTTYTDIRGGNVNIDSIWYSSIIVQEIPAYTGNSVTKRMQLYADKGNYKIVKAVSNSREITSTNPTPDVSGESYFPLAPTAPTTFTNFLGKQPFDEITIHALNGNVTIANNANIITNTGANIVLLANQVLKLHRTSMAFGGSWIVHTGAVLPPTVSNNTIPLWSNSSNRFLNSVLSQAGGELFSGGALNGPGFFSSIGLYASNSGGVGNSFSNASTNANAGAYFRARNNLNYDLLLSSKGSTEAKANTGVIDYSGPNGIELSTSDGGAGAGPIVLSPSGTEKLKADATGVKVTIGSDAARDMWFRDASTGYLKRIPYGTTGQVLTATTGSDPAWSNPGELTATFTTSDATPTTVVTIAPITGEVVTVEAVLDGIKSDGNSSVGGKKIRTFLRNASGTLSQSSETTTQAVNYLGGGLTTATFTITTSGSDIIIQFTGEASTTITGTVKYKINRSAAPL